MKISVNNTYFSYNSVNVLDNICFTIEDSDFVGILGPNGSGKSTLIKCINRILRVKQGSILLGGNNIETLGLRHLARLVSYVPQYTNNKNTSSVYEILELGRCPYITWKLKTSDREAIEKVIEDLQLKPFLRKSFSQLSGGEQQKVKIGRALVQEPKVLLLDEPTNNLDLRHQVEVLSLLSEIVKNRGISAIMAIHDINLAAKYSYSVILLSKGKIVDIGEPANVINKQNIKNVYDIDVEIVVHKNSILIAI
jgi:iron complex transport system ATP-binding protein